MSLTPQSLPEAEDMVAWIRDRAESRLSAVREHADRLRNDQQPNALGVLGAWDEMTLALSDTGASGSLFSNVHPDEEVREAAEASVQEVQRLSTELGLDMTLFKIFAALDLDDPSLDAPARRLLNKILVDFQRAGVDRDDATRDRIAEINERLTTLDQTFSRTIRDDTGHLRLRPDQLRGLPEDWLTEHEAGEDGMVAVSTEYPDALPVRMYADDPEAREQMAAACLNVGWPENHDVLTEMFALRHELASLIGYADWPSFDAEQKMIGEGPAIAEFIDRISAAATEPMQRDRQVLLERYRADYPDAESLPAAHAMHYTELVRKERFEVDSQQVRQYFDFAKVHGGLLDVTSKLFDLRYEPVTDVRTWHKDVSCFDVYDTRADATASHLGRIYLDLHPRSGKYNHAAQFTLSEGVAGHQLPEGVLVCNFSRTLMEHDHVVTLFHEFGHLLHHVLAGHGPWARFAGVATEWDFVEAPSQMLEEWAWDPEVLASFATNAEGQPIPAELVAAMRRGEEFGKGIFAATQMFYAAMSYYFHAERPADLTERMRQLQADYAPFEYIEGTHMFANFGHLGGYSSAYYTYMWSLVIAKDMFSCFDPADLFDAADTGVAARYRDEVLAPGGLADAAVLVENFLGRAYTFDAYAEWLAKPA